MHVCMCMCWEEDRLSGRWKEKKTNNNQLMHNDERGLINEMKNKRNENKMAKAAK